MDTENKKSRKLLNTLPLTLQYMEADNENEFDQQDSGMDGRGMKQRQRGAALANE